MALLAIARAVAAGRLPRPWESRVAARKIPRAILTHNGQGANLSPFVGAPTGGKQHDSRDACKAGHLANKFNVCGKRCADALRCADRGEIAFSHS